MNTKSFIILVWDKIFHSFWYNPFLCKYFYIIYHLLWQWYVQKTLLIPLYLTQRIQRRPSYLDSSVTPWPKEAIFTVIYLILCVVHIINVMTKTNLKQLLFYFWALEKWFVTWKNIKPRSCPLYPPNPGRNQAENILNHTSKVFCDIYLTYTLKFDLWILCARRSGLKDFMR